MKTLLVSMVLAAALAAAGNADAARRFGGGSNLGKQRAVPAQSAPAPKEAAPAPGATPAPTSATPPLAPKPSFMSRWGGVLAGLGIGALLASLFGAQLGPLVGVILVALLVVGIAGLLLRLLAGRRPGEPAPQFAGIGSHVSPAVLAPPAAAGSAAQPSFEKEPFLRVAKTSFIRLQVANDARDLDDIRDYTTPEMYAEIAMQITERGAEAQRTEVVNLNADLVDTAVEGDYEIASVRFHGLIRENDAANPAPFDEVWHVRKDRRDRGGAWLIAGIQQAA